MRLNFNPQLATILRKAVLSIPKGAIAPAYTSTLGLRRIVAWVLLAQMYYTEDFI
ncbi:hypothetical protein LC605_18850 [Nostoc sp. CHAB 5836]|uniref:hypothetical protein n=1 Tax=Nostoc sp. CHAB 5836 TaxID=2780404 RepID=UPI001E308AEB|nr:hypothetical protein [Nostoc sp. CHAB 5836]MCC5617101.1 hypothetical protein [Nostoc sp. CHAB 5836]